MTSSTTLEKKGVCTIGYLVDGMPVQLYGDVVIIYSDDGSGKELIRVPLEYCSNQKIKALIAVLLMPTFREDV